MTGVHTRAWGESSCEADTGDAGRWKEFQGNATFNLIGDILECGATFEPMRGELICLSIEL